MAPYLARHPKPPRWSQEKRKARKRKEKKQKTFS